MTPDQGDWTFEACQDRLRTATQNIQAAEHAYKQAIERSADAEAVYRSEVGKAFTHHRDDGAAVEAARIQAHRDCARLSRERDYAAGMVKLRAEQIENARDARRTVWRLVEWARARDLGSSQ